MKTKIKTKSKSMKYGGKMSSRNGRLMNGLIMAVVLASIIYIITYFTLPKGTASASGAVIGTMAPSSMIGGMFAAMYDSVMGLFLPSSAGSSSASPAPVVVSAPPAIVDLPAVQSVAPMGTGSAMPMGTGSAMPMP